MASIPDASWQPPFAVLQTTFVTVSVCSRFIFHVVLFVFLPTYWSLLVAWENYLLSCTGIMLPIPAETLRNSAEGIIMRAQNFIASSEIL